MIDAGRLRDNGPTCTVCGKHTAAGIYLCAEDTTRLEDALQDVGEVLSGLGAVVIRDTAYGATIGGRSGDEQPLAFDEHALTVGYELRELLNSWASLLAEHVTTRPHDPRSPASVACWILANTNTIRHHEWAGDCHDEIRAAVRNARRASDKRPARMFAGMCPTRDSSTQLRCSKPLYALPGKPVVNCNQCGEQYDVNGWRADALAAAGLTTGTPAQISRALTDHLTGEALPAATIRQWASRKQLIRSNGPEVLHAIGSGARIVPAKQYLIQEVSDLWARMKASQYGNPNNKRGTQFDSEGLVT